MNARHQGKVVLKAPPRGRVADFSHHSTNAPFSTRKRPIWSPGDLSGFGIRIVAFLVASGARHIVLMDRDPERRRDADWVLRKSRVDQFFTDRLSEIKIEIVSGDVAEEKDVRRCVADLAHPLKGVFHLAGVLDDCLLADLSPDSVSKVFAPKARGALNLHHATADCPLDHFVLFSSITSVLGNPGQINYGAANGFLDALASYRRRRGLPALSYNMAAVAQTGMAARNLRVLKTMKAAGMPAVTALFTALNLDYAMRAMPDKDHLITCLFKRPLWRADSPDYMRTGRLVHNADCFDAGAGGGFEWAERDQTDHGQGRRVMRP